MTTRVLVATGDLRAPSVPIDHLTPMVDYGDAERTVYADLDDRGMRNPILAFRVSEASYRTDHAKRAQRIPGRVVDGEVYMVKFGNQRLAWARLRGYTEVAAYVCDSQQDCYKRLRLYRDV